MNRVILLVSLTSSLAERTLALPFGRVTARADGWHTSASSRYAFDPSELTVAPALLPL